jgi:carbon monoxide dehydrogenase subunit G
MPASADVAWALLQDIETVAGCMPGAKITQRLDAAHYKGTVAVKFGPASMSFRGDVTVKSIDSATRTLLLTGTGTDNTGSSGATMDLTARVEAVDGASCNLVGVSEVSMSGKAASFGGRMMGSVADQVLKQFAANFATLAAARQTQPPPPPANGIATGATKGTTAKLSPPLDVAQAPAAKMPATAAPVMPVQLDGLALLWAIVRDWFGKLFSARKV